MITKEQIMNSYAKEKGYEDWTHLICSHVFDSSDGIMEHFDNVVDLIQDELKKKCADNAVDKFLERHINWGDLERTIVNTPNL